MPWVFSIDEIEFTPETLDHFPDHAAEIAKIVTSFSLIESVAGAIYGVLKNTTIEAALAELAKLTMNQRRVQAIIKLIKDTPGTVHAAETLRVLDRVLNYAVERNKIAHGMWGAVAGDAENLHHVQVKKAIPFFAALVANGSAGQPMKGVDEFQSCISTYSLADLKALAKTGKALLKDVSGCYNAIGKAAAIADGWMETTNPETGEPMLRTPPTN